MKETKKIEKYILVDEDNYFLLFNWLNSFTDALNQTTTFQYDANGNLTKTIDPLLNETTITYNSFGQPETVTDPLLNTTQFEYDTEGNLIATEDSLGNQTARAYDAVSRLISLTDPLERKTKFDYDFLNRVTQITDAKNQITGFTYDANGNLLTVTDANSNTTTYTYDVQDRLDTRTDSLNRQESYTYDLYGNLKTFTDRKLQVSTFTYDALDRRTLSQYDDGSTTSFTYDTAGRLTAAEDSTSGRIEFSYDNIDRLAQELTPQGTVGYQYDAIGRRTTMTVNGQTPVTYQHDSNSRLTQVAQGTQVVGVGYDAAGRRTGLTYPNGVNTTYTYDTASRLTNILHQGPSSIIEDLTYTYDAAGNRVSLTRSSGASTVLPGPVQAAYDAANEQIQFDSTTPNLPYDANGNLTSQTDANGTTTYTWDSRNRLVAISGPGISANFVYDVLGRRISKTINGITTDFQYDGNDIVAEAGGNSIDVTYLRSLNIDEPFIKQGVNEEFYHTDALGSSLVLSDSSGLIDTTYEYEVFGKTTINGPSTNPFQYTGRENDGSGLLYYRARFYSPRVHRFISEDPLGFRGGINKYAYVKNDPLSFVDPSGLADSATPWQVGFEWLTGLGPRTHDFTAGDPFTEVLKQHSHIEELRKQVTQACSSVPSSAQFDYSLSGVDGVVKYVQDYSTLATGGLTGNLAVTYLGSYQFDYTVKPLSGRKVELIFSIKNTSTLESATRPPVIGYTNWWQENVGPILNRITSSGPLSPRTQTFNWSEVLRCQ